MDVWNLPISSLLYSPLVGDDPLRLLRLKPGQRSDPIVCELVPTRLDEVDKTYLATSYTWGSPENPQHITCNGQNMKIQRNAFDMLNDLRLPGEPRLVWIDAICINQSDLDERSAQVSIMHKIYSQCHCVMIWLGQGDEDSHISMKFAEGLDSTRYIKEFVDVIKTSGLPAQAQIFQRKDYLFDPEPRNDEEKRRAVSIVRFINRPWFNRVWVQQEGSVSWNTQVVCGPDTINWHQIFALGWLLSPPRTAVWPDYFPYTFAESGNNLFAIQGIQNYKLCAFRSEYGLGDSFPRTRCLNNMLIDAPRFASTDPRDKVFAMMNLRMLETNDWAPKPNYRIPWEVLFTDVAARVLKQGWLRALSISGKARQPPNWILPSWVPDYRQWDASVRDSMSQLAIHEEWMAGGPRGTREGQVPWPLIAAKSGQLPRRHRRKINPADMSEQLRLKGSSKQMLQTFISLRIFMVDEIVYTGRPLSSDLESSLTGTKYCELIRQDLDFIQSKFPAIYLNGNSVLDAYKLTIIAATDHNEGIVGPEYTSKYWDPWFRWLGAHRCDLDDVSSGVPLFNRAARNSGIFRDFCFAITKHGYFCLVPATVQPKDCVTVVKGHAVPLVIRPYTPPAATEQGAEYFELIGDAYVHGMMTNEAGCIMLELDCKANPTPTQREKILKAAQNNDGEAWRTLDFGDYTAVIDTIGPRWINLV
ncbi:hypothetical protein NM208_g9908 [Fusarium decemcellulare]|uniref:Uncharacterized protein n=1 Tax=Fusarium decemcellulare TaxID=57161 RepID=A0ACC1RZW9_9HYPO|nr:hypothetical protein NM208_g9908 [Fusarium decemcellulare]